MPGIILGSGNVAAMKTDKSLYLWNSLERKIVACFLKQESQYTSGQGKMSNTEHAMQRSKTGRYKREHTQGLILDWVIAEASLGSYISAET